MVENAIWTHEEVVFGTVHVTGSGNNFFINNQERALEAIARNKTNVEWIKRIFSEAQETDAKGVVIALHTALFSFSGRRAGEFTGLAVRRGVNGPFHWIVLAIRDLGAEFGRPVLVVHGDFHEFEIDLHRFFYQAIAILRRGRLPQKRLDRHVRCPEAARPCQISVRRELGDVGTRPCWRPRDLFGIKPPAIRNPAPPSASSRSVDRFTVEAYRRT